MPGKGGAHRSAMTGGTAAAGSERCQAPLRHGDTREHRTMPQGLAPPAMHPSRPHTFFSFLPSSFFLSWYAGRALPEVTGRPRRICAIDFGVNNLMAVTSNCGPASVLYKGSVLKSVNQYYNKRIAFIVSEQTLATGKKFVPTEQ